MNRYLLAAALLAPLAAPQAQVTFTEAETAIMSGDGTTTYTTTETMAVSAASTPPQMVQVKLPDGTMATIPNTTDAPWYTDARIGGSRNFKFDPLTGAYVIYAGDDFTKRWDDNGNPVKVKPAPKPAAKPAAAAVTEPVTETSTEQPAATEESLALEAAMAEAVTPTVTTVVSTTITTTVEGETGAVTTTEVIHTTH